MKNKLRSAAAVLTILLCVLACTAMTAFSANKLPEGRFYELPGGSNYAYSMQNEVSSFTHGRAAMGTLILSGTAGEETTCKGSPACGTDGTVTFGYRYDGAFQNGSKDAWNLHYDPGSLVYDFRLSKTVNSGAVIIEKSPDGVAWELAMEPVTDFFAKNPKGNEAIYTTPEAEIMNGMFYRITVAYTMTRRTEASTVAGVIPNDRYEYRECVEVYKYYIASQKDFLTFHELRTGTALEDGDAVTGGFCLRTNGSDAAITVKREGASTVSARDYDYFIKPGTYTIESTNSLGVTHTARITVEEGMAFTELIPTVFESEKNGSYQTEVELDGNTVFGKQAMTRLSLARVAGTALSQSTKNGFPAYGLSTKGLSLYLRLRTPADRAGNGWQVSHDTRGGSDKIFGVAPGEIGSGALIVQTSRNGNSWSNVKLGVYNQGLSTTDYAAYREANENVLIYTPSGEDIRSGLYVRVAYAYQVSHTATGEKRSYVETYTFYLCSSELDAVTFHNLSLAGQVDTLLGDAGETTLRLHRAAETMLPGACTTSAFQVDTSLNPTVTYTVRRNGTPIPNTYDNRYTQTGRYDIHLTSAVGGEKDVVLYIDRSTEEEAFAMYFGEGFLSGKRIYAEGEYPVYEGGEVRCRLASVSESFLPLTGTITNLTTGSVTEISHDRTAKLVELTEPGEYVAELTNNPGYRDDDASGDARIYIFRFSVIAGGTAPGPVVNQRNLQRFAASNVSDAYPMYYGLVYQSASKGTITLAFATREAAADYAYHYEKGMVEQQADGTFRYNGSFYVTQKEKYNSAWDLTDAMYYFAGEAVQELYFDLSDEFTYLTLSEELVEATENLRTLELDRSVTLFAEGEREKLCAMGGLPVLSPKPYAILSAGMGGSVTRGFHDFAFIRDPYGCDSDSVVITDGNGTEYPIAYSEGVGAQLQKAGCPSGILTVTETTVYGDSVSYEAVFLAEDDNTAELKLNAYTGGAETEQTYAQADDGAVITADAFRIAAVTDALDPCTLITVADGSSQKYYVADRVAADAWSEPGEYVVSVINRLGASYRLTVVIRDSGYATVEFAGDGTEQTRTIITSFGAQSVKLPEVTRYGYELAGFADENGTLYTGEIPEVLFKGTKVLEPVWEAKQVTLHWLNEEGRELAAPVTAAFGETCPLPRILADGAAVTGWILDGTVLEGAELTIDREGDIRLTAVQMAEKPDERADETSGGGGWLIAVLVIVLGIGGGILLKRQKRAGLLPGKLRRKTEKKEAAR